MRAALAPGSPRQRRPRRRPPCGRVAMLASAPREARGPPRVASPRPRRVCRWRPRGVRPRPRRRVPPPRASRGARADATWHRARRLSPGGRTGSATRTAGPSTARRCRRRRRRRGSVSPDSSRCAPRLSRRRSSRSTRLHLARARRRRARRGVRDGQPRRRDERLPAVIVSALTKTAALVASAASQAVSLAAAVAAGARLRRGGPGGGGRRRRRSMAALRAELAELRVAVADAAAAAKRETTHGTRGAAASSASLDEVSGDASTRSRAFLFDAPGVASAVAAKTRSTRDARLSANVDFERHRTPFRRYRSPTERTNPDGKDGKEASPSDLVSTSARARSRRRKKRKKRSKSSLPLRLELRSAARVRELEALEWCRPHRRG